MPNQTQNGYAFEYAIVSSITDVINELNFIYNNTEINISIIQDECFENIKSNFEQTPERLKRQMTLAAKAGLRKVIEMEPRLSLATKSDPVLVYSKPASAGISGDVRDMVMIRHLAPTRRLQQTGDWEIGISAKWNNDVIKNSRLAERLDFCQSWFGFPCTQEYWGEISTTMLYLNKHLGQPWRTLPNKIENVYLTLTNAFINEINRQIAIHDGLPGLLVEYLLGKFDFYKLIGVCTQHVTNIQAFNHHRTLNQDCESISPKIRIPSQVNQMPTRFVSIGHYRNRPAWVEIILDNGWQFTMRLHNAETNIIPSLKFDIRFVGSPINTWSERW